jgi:hypothetical protein
VSDVDETKVVVKAEPFQVTAVAVPPLDPAVKLVPVTVKLKVELPYAALDGESRLTEGRPTITPGLAESFERIKLPAVTKSAAGIVSVPVVGSQ